MDSQTKEVLEMTDKEEVYNETQEETQEEIKGETTGSVQNIVDRIRKISDDYQIQRMGDIKTILKLTFNYFIEQIEKRATEGYRFVHLLKFQDINDPEINKFYMQYDHCISFEELDKDIIEMFEQEGFEIINVLGYTQVHW